MAIDLKYLSPISELVHELVVGNYEKLEVDGRSGRLSADDLRKAIGDYGRKLVDITENEIGLADSYPVDGRKGEWVVDLPLRTVEEGRSDLTLSFTLSSAGDEFSLKIDDLHVL